MQSVCARYIARLLHLPVQGPTEILMQGNHQPEQGAVNVDEVGSGVPVLLCGRERAEAKDSPDFADVKLLSPVCSSGSFFEAFCIATTVCQVQSCRQPTHTSPMAESTPAMHQQGLKGSGAARVRLVGGEDRVGAG